MVITNKKGRKVAIEVETGIDVGTFSKKKYHNEKFAARKKEYGENCFIFLIKSNLEDSYGWNGLPLLFRTNIEIFIKEQF